MTLLYYLNTRTGERYIPGQERPGDAIAVFDVEPLPPPEPIPVPPPHPLCCCDRTSEGCPVQNHRRRL